MKMLIELTAPVELRWYRPTDASGLSAELHGYVSRVGELLTEYDRLAAGKLSVIPQDPQGNAAAKAAASQAGIIPFADAKGDSIYLGLVAICGSQTAPVPLNPEWESALEADLSRAIQRVSGKPGAAPVKSATGSAPVIDPAVSDELLRQFPDLASRSFEELAQSLRLAAFREFEAATAELQGKVTLAQKELTEAQANNGTVAADAARQNLQRVQAEQADKLKAITARLQERIQTLQQLKNVQ
jgi:hypothetical protein